MEMVLTESCGSVLGEEARGRMKVGHGKCTLSEDDWCCSGDSEESSDRHIWVPDSLPYDVVSWRDRF